jgi:cytosine deaminase
MHPTGGRRPDPVDVLVDGDTISAIRPAGELVANGATELDADGRLLSPPLVDPHVHMDAVLTVGEPRYNESGTLIEGILTWAERKKTLTHEDV